MTHWMAGVTRALSGLKSLPRGVFVLPRHAAWCSHKDNRRPTHGLVFGSSTITLPILPLLLSRTMKWTVVAPES
jgi:hypothetical protein